MAVESWRFGWAWNVAQVGDSNTYRILRGEPFENGRLEDNMER
jgi:hypothetical protein